MRFTAVAGRWLGWWAALFGLYLLLAATLTLPEVIVGAAAAALAAIAATVTARAGHLCYRPRLAWAGRFRQVPLAVLVDCGVVAGALWRRLVRRQQVQGAFRTIPFDPGGDDAASAVRRALITAGISVAPNTYVVTIDRERGLLLVHDLVPPSRSPGGGDKEWPL